MNFTGPIMTDYLGPKFNNFWDHRDVTYESGTVTEPVTLAEMKDYLRLQGFTDDDESPAETLSDFAFDNALITDMIRAGRETLEQVCGLSLVPKSIQAMITNLLGGQEIKYGPNIVVTELLDSNGTAITTYTLSGVSFKRLMTPCYKDMKISYSAGYTTIPKPIKIDLMRLVAYMYTNRGDQEGSLKFAANMAAKYSRNTWLV